MIKNTGSNAVSVIVLFHVFYFSFLFCRKRKSLLFTFEQIKKILLECHCHGRCCGCSKCDMHVFRPFTKWNWHTHTLALKDRLREARFETIKESTTTSKTTTMSTAVVVMMATVATLIWQTHFMRKLILMCALVLHTNANKFVVFFFNIKMIVCRMGEPVSKRLIDPFIQIFELVKNKSPNRVDTHTT